LIDLQGHGSEREMLSLRSVDERDQQHSERPLPRPDSVTARPNRKSGGSQLSANSTERPIKK
jgi:hypothetical protein